MRKTDVRETDRQTTMQFPLSHTPPSMPVGSLEAPQSKRPRAGSVSGRLRSASDLCEDGTISQNQKGLVKDMIISGDPELARALGEYEKETQNLLKNC